LMLAAVHRTTAADAGCCSSGASATVSAARELAVPVTVSGVLLLTETVAIIRACCRAACYGGSMCDASCCTAHRLL
jgi:hypothetical protein